MRLQTGWRILRAKNGQPHTLFHGYEGTRALPLDRVLRAEERQVWNPGKRASGSPGFISGWHILPNERECREYLTRFKDHSDLVVCRVGVAAVRPKPRSKVLLSRFMRITSEDWDNALTNAAPKETISP